MLKETWRYFYCILQILIESESFLLLNSHPQTSPENFIIFIVFKFGKLKMFL